jgi:hypothetical protein
MKIKCMNSTKMANKCACVTQLGRRCKNIVTKPNRFCNKHPGCGSDFMGKAMTFCQCRTRDGLKCTRRAMPSSTLCWQHFRQSRCKRTFDRSFSSARGVRKSGSKTRSHPPDESWVLRPSGSYSASASASAIASASASASASARPVFGPPGKYNHMNAFARKQAEYNNYMRARPGPSAGQMTASARPVFGPPGKYNYLPESARKQAEYDNYMQQRGFGEVCECTPGVWTPREVQLPP